MKPAKTIIDCFILTFIVCCCIFNLRNSRLTPEYKDIDFEIAPYVNEYMDLAKTMGIEFKNKVTIGFKDINKGAIIGECHFGLALREIDIDKTWWKYATPTSRFTLIFHELAHCYCGRIHDYGPGKEYVDEWEGRLEDGCPQSIMYPKIISDECMESHYEDYIIEAFDRCKPY